MANRHHVEILGQGNKAVLQWRAAHPLACLDLSEAELAGHDLAELNLREADLRGADLRRAQLAQAILWRACLRNADLSEANLAAANLREADLTAAVLRQAQLPGADLRSASVYFGEADLSEANLNGANLRGANLRGANLRRAGLSKADLLEANLNGADLREADLRGAAVNWTSLWGPNPEQSDLISVTADFSEARLTGADLSGADLSGIHLGRAELQRAKLRETRLRGANLIGAVLRQADLSGADLNRANLDWADLRGADLRSADLTGASLRGTDLRGANLEAAWFGDTLVANAHLEDAGGLHALRHVGPSSIDHRTLARASLPAAFLAGCGLATGGAAPGVGPSVLIVSVEPDRELGERLKADLESRRWLTWLTHDAYLQNFTFGFDFWYRMRQLIRMHERVVLILSEHSLRQDPAGDWGRWLKDAAEEEGRRRSTPYFFAIRLDERALQLQRTWLAELRDAGAIADFTAWRQAEGYQLALRQLLAHMGVPDDSSVGV